MLHVYVFKFDQNTAENGLNQDLMNYLNCITTTNGDIINYYPSKKLVIVGLNNPTTGVILDWILKNVKYKFEFEEHYEGCRTLTQIDPDSKYGFMTSYLLPLFTPESYLEI
jgi:hypothetical protein